MSDLAAIRERDAELTDTSDMQTVFTDRRVLLALVDELSGALHEITSNGLTDLEMLDVALAALAKVRP